MRPLKFNKDDIENQILKFSHLAPPISLAGLATHTCTAQLFACAAWSQCPVWTYDNTCDLKSYLFQLGYQQLSSSKERKATQMPWDKTENEWTWCNWWLNDVHIPLTKSFPFRLADSFFGVERTGALRGVRCDLFWPPPGIFFFQKKRWKAEENSNFIEFDVYLWKWAKGHRF